MRAHYGVEGLGQQGQTFIAKLLQGLKVPPRKVIVWDIRPDRIAATVAKFPGVRVASSFEEFARSADMFVVAVNTPAHHDEIEKLATLGARHVLCESGTGAILCEKPLAQNVVALRKIRALKARFPQLRVYTALVIEYSDARRELFELMESEHLDLVEFCGRWGKNRAAARELRETAGDRRDELIHMLELGLGLVRHRGLRAVEVLSAQVSYLNFANADAQRRAHERDSSFDLVPDSSTRVMLSAELERGTVELNFASSFTEAENVRQVWGTFVAQGTNEPRYSFSVKFDEKREGVVGDEVLITELRSDTPRRLWLPCDKMLTLTQAFADSQSGVVDPRLATVEWAGTFVELSDAIGESAIAFKNREPRIIRVPFLPAELMTATG